MEKLIVTVTGRALFDLRQADQVYRTSGKQKYFEYMHSLESTTLKPGPAFYLVEAFNKIVHPVTKEPLITTTLVSQTHATAAVPILNSIEAYKLNISQMAFTGGAAQIPYIKAFGSDLFLSFNPDDVIGALGQGVASALLLSEWPEPESSLNEVRIAFDGDAVLFSDESEQIYSKYGIDKFVEVETKNAHVPLMPGPFKNLLVKLHTLQSVFGDARCPIVTALVTARGGRVLKRPIMTLKDWNVMVNVAIGLNGQDKDKVVEAFKPHIFFDDRLSNCQNVSRVSPSAQILGVTSTAHGAPQLKSQD
jgi:5'-nucleotidase